MSTEELIDKATVAVADALTDIGILLAALEKIEEGLRAIGSVRANPDEWPTKLGKSEVWQIAFNALSEVDARRIIRKSVDGATTAKSE